MKTSIFTFSNAQKGIFAIVLTLAFLFAGCSKRSSDSIELDRAPQPEVKEFELDKLAPSEDELRELLNSSTPKQKMRGDIAHYEFKVRLGPGPYDVVRIHRVVRERRPFRPVRTRGAVFMTHGSSLNFEAIFLNAGSDNPTPETSVALYLAENNIDVWGMDYAWTLVPEETTDFTFMKDWGVEKDIDHTLAAMSIARFFRGFTGQGFGRLNLLGYSYGGALTYGAAGKETQQHRFLRDIRGIIPVDAPFKVEDPETSPLAPCVIAENSRNNLDMERYHNSQGVLLGTISNLATNMPEAPSPLPPFKGLTNYQVALAVGIFPLGARPYWHHIAGDDESIESGVPVGFKYTDPSRWIVLLESLPPYMPVRPGYELNVVGCAKQDISLDDHLGEISVPILYLGAGGGTGTVGHFAPGLTASDDVTTHTVSLSDNPLADFGHGDLFLAENAADLVWEELRKWLVDHSSRRHRFDRKDEDKDDDDWDDDDEEEKWRDDEDNEDED